MNPDPIFNSAENQALLAVCARKTIRTAGIAGIIWGSINLLLGAALVLANPINAGILVLALLMLGTGVMALRKPSLGVLLGEAVVSLLLLCWNIGVSVLNARAGDTGHIDGHGFIFPAIAAAIFFAQYKRLGHLKDTVASMDHAVVKEAATICKQIFKTKVKNAPDVVQATSNRCRLKLMSDSVLCVQRNLARAFSLNRTDFQQCLLHPEKARLRVVVRHPLGKLTYAFDRKNSEKIKSWLGTSAPTATTTG